MTRHKRDRSPGLFDWATEKAARQRSQAATHNAMRQAALRKEHALEGKRQQRREAEPPKARHRETKPERRLREIGLIIQDQHHGACTTDDGTIYLEAALPSLLNQAGGAGSETLASAVESWRLRWVPLVPSETALEMVAELERVVLQGENIQQNALTAGNLLNLTLERRTRLGITSIRPAGYTDEMMKDLRREQDRKRKEDARRKAGVKPREKTKTIAQLAAEIGKSRATFCRMGLHKPGALEAWKRAQAEGETPGSAAGSLDPIVDRIAASHASSGPTHGPARTDRPNRSVGADVAPPGAKTKAKPTTQTVEPPLPMMLGDEHPSLPGLGEWQLLGDVVRTVVLAWGGGPLPPMIVDAILDKQRMCDLAQKDVARLIGVSPEHLNNAMKFRKAFGPEPTRRLKSFLLA